MFTPIHLLPRYSAELHEKYNDRWNHGEGPAIREKILDMLKKGAGEDFLVWDFQEGRLPILENEADLRGITIFKMEIDFPKKEDNFTGVDFSYASFYHTILRNATISSAIFNFTKFYNCEFVNCKFAFTHFYGAVFEKSRFTGCDFLEYVDMTNCELKNAAISQCFYAASFLADCRFDQQTTIDNPRNVPNDTTFRLKLENKELAEIFRGIKEAYRAGQVSKQTRAYFLKQRKAITRYNTRTVSEKFVGYFLELVAGYGISPLRVLISMLLVFLAFSVAFTIKLGFVDGFLLSAGAFFTFGANTQFLQNMAPKWHIIYATESFFGVAFMAFFVTVLANLWFSERYYIFFTPLCEQ